VRIAVPIHSFEPGGVERVALNLCAAWQEAGADVTVVLGGEGGGKRSTAPPPGLAPAARHVRAGGAGGNFGGSRGGGIDLAHLGFQFLPFYLHILVKNFLVKLFRNSSPGIFYQDIQLFIFYKSMDKLDEKGLWPWFWLLDIWMFFYYLIFMPSIWKRPKTSWR